MVYVVAQNNPAILRLYKPGEGRGGRGGGGAGGGPAAAALAAMPGAAVYTRECSSCHGPDRAGGLQAPTLLTVAGRIDAATIHDIITNGRGRMPPVPHVTAPEADQIAAYLLAGSLNGGPARAGGAGAGRGRGAPAASPFPPEAIVQSGSVKERAGGRGGADALAGDPPD